MRSIDDAIEWIYGLHVGVTGTGTARHERPHKPVLLLAVLDMIAQGHATPDNIPWSRKLRERFIVYFDLVRTPQDQNTPDNPFFRLNSDGHWEGVEITAGTVSRLRDNPLMGALDKGTIRASLTGGLEHFVLSATDRLTLRQHIISRFFPGRSRLLEPHFQEGSMPAKVAEDPDTEYDTRPGRNSAFRRKILEIYDCQCAACGLRIKMPEVPDLTFVDAAHIIPFNVEPNDHPSNGLALCKNHHWAMDRFLIAPGEDRIWRISSRIIPHRSPGENDLAELAGKPVLPPAEPAFAPARESLAWRCARLAG